MSIEQVRAYLRKLMDDFEGGGTKTTMGRIGRFAVGGTRRTYSGWTLGGKPPPKKSQSQLDNEANIRAARQMAAATMSAEMSQYLDDLGIKYGKRVL